MLSMVTCELYMRNINWTAAAIMFANGFYRGSYFVYGGAKTQPTTAAAPAAVAAVTA